MRNIYFSWHPKAKTTKPQVILWFQSQFIWTEQFVHQFQFCSSYRIILTIPIPRTHHLKKSLSKKKNLFFSLFYKSIYRQWTNFLFCWYGVSKHFPFFFLSFFHFQHARYFCCLSVVLSVCQTSHTAAVLMYISMGFFLSNFVTYIPYNLLLNVILYSYSIKPLSKPYYIGIRNVKF